MRRQASRPQGFTLIEAAVAVGIIAILASAAAPLVMKALNQQRERTTRDGLKIAFEAMFGSRERQVANMRSDFAFDPGGQLADLRRMTTRTPANLALWGSTGGTQFNWGWNGPYWTGPVRTQNGTGGLPIDAWGRLITLRVVSGGYQMRSSGPDGALNTGDDLVYPTAPFILANSDARVKVDVKVYKFEAGIPVPQTINAASRITALWPAEGRNPGGGVARQVTDPNCDFPNLPAGPFQVTVDIRNSGLASPNPVTQVVNLSPSEQRTIVMNFQVN